MEQESDDVIKPAVRKINERAVQDILVVVKGVSKGRRDNFEDQKTSANDDKLHFRRRLKKFTVGEFFVAKFRAVKV